jgi:MtN3 and saliva related transmembrane protein
MQHYIELIGICAGICTTVSFIPQILQIWRTRSASSISFPMYIIFSIGVSLWIIYGTLMHATAVVLANSVTLVLSISILVMKIIWK